MPRCAISSCICTACSSPRRTEPLPADDQLYGCASGRSAQAWKFSARLCDRRLFAAGLCHLEGELFPARLSRGLPHARAGDLYRLARQSPRDAGDGARSQQARQPHLAASRWADGGRPLRGLWHHHHFRRGGQRATGRERRHRRVSRAVARPRRAPVLAAEVPPVPPAGIAPPASYPWRARPAGRSSRSPPPRPAAASSSGSGTRTRCTTRSPASRWSARRCCGSPIR